MYPTVSAVILVESVSEYQYLAQLPLIDYIDKLP